jgi:hypothetical protein
MLSLGFLAAATIGCDQPPEGTASGGPSAEEPDLVTLTTVAGNGRGQMAVVSEKKITRAEHTELLAARQLGRKRGPEMGVSAGSVLTQAAFTNTGNCWDLSTILINSGTNFGGSQTLCVKWDSFQGAQPWWIGFTPRSYDPSRNFAGEFCAADLIHIDNCTWFGGSQTTGTFCNGTTPNPNFTGGGGYVKMENWGCIP